MTVINQNSISGITSITAASGSVQIFNSDGSSGSLTDLAGVNVAGVVTATSYSGTSSTIKFETGGSERARIDSSGRFGIGESAPESLLHLKGSSATLKIESSVNTGYSGVEFDRAADDTHFAIYAYDSSHASQANNVQFYGYQAGRLDFHTNSSASPRLSIASGGNIGIGTSSPSSKFHVIGGTTSGSVDTAAIFTGGVINTVGSGARIYLSGTPGFETTRGTYIEGVFDTATNAHSLRFATNSSSADPVERMRITSSGNVGIGTTSPSAPLHINGTANNTAITLSVGGTVTGYIGPAGFIGGSDSNMGYRVESGNSHTFHTGATERARIDSSGRLLVGTSSARTNIAGGTQGVLIEGSSSTNSQNRFTTHVYGDNSTQGPYLGLAKTRSASIGGNTIVQNGDELGGIYFHGADGNDLRQAAYILAVSDGTPGVSDMPGRLSFATTADGDFSPTERLRINNAGSLTVPRVYTDTTANAANVWVNSNGDLARSTSSEKYKKSIETIEDSYSNALLSCRPVWYRSTCKNDNPNHGWWGFIAEEVAAIDPRLVHWKTIEVTYDEKGFAVETPCEPEPEGVAYDRFVPHLLNLIKRQGEAIADLQAEVAALKTQ